MLTAPDLLGGIGRLLVGLGTVMMLFALYQLWGSGLLEWRAQSALDARFEAAMIDHDVRRAVADVVATDRRGRLVATAGGLAVDGRGSVELASPAAADIGVDVVAGPPVQAPPPTRATAPIEGEAIGRMEIPAIGVVKTIVEGVSRPTLRNGPGHYPTTPLPGHRGNAAIAGHRTTHGAPFLDLDLLRPGDEIMVETVDGRFTYRVEAQPDGAGGVSGHRLVDPSAVEVIGDRGDNRLTLTACHPKYSARQRIIVTAVLVGAPVDDVVAALTPPVDPARPVRARPGPPTAADTTAPGPVPTEQALPLPSPVGWDPEPGSARPSVPEPVIRRVFGGTPGEAVDPGATLHSGEDALTESLGWQHHELEPTVLWATMSALMAFAGWALGRLWRRRPARVITAVSLVAPLFAYFVHLDRLLPAF
ncbi:MAG: sortase [Acidimicrobiales bacterium]